MKNISLLFIHASCIRYFTVTSDWRACLCIL